jgi:hypothetical protein
LKILYIEFAFAFYFLIHFILLWKIISLFIYLSIIILLLYYIIMLGGGTLCRLHRFLPCIKYMILEFTPLLLSFIPPISWKVSTGIIFALTYMCTQYLHHIHERIYSWHDLTLLSLGCLARIHFSHSAFLSSSVLNWLGTVLGCGSLTVSIVPAHK